MSWKAAYQGAVRAAKGDLQGYSSCRQKDMFLYEEIRGSFYYNLVFTRPDPWQNANGPRARQDESHDGTAKSVEIEDAQA